MSLSKTSSASRIYVGNLPQFVRQRELEDHFDRYGRVQGIDIHSRFDPAFAFIEFEDPRFVSLVFFYFNFKSNGCYHFSSYLGFKKG